MQGPNFVCIFFFFPFHGWIKVDKSHLVFYQYMPSASQQEGKKSVIFALRDFCRFKNITHKGRHHYKTIYLVIYIYILYILQPEPVLLYVVLMNQSILQPNLFKAPLRHNKPPKTIKTSRISDQPRRAVWQARAKSTKRLARMAAVRVEDVPD